MTQGGVQLGILVFVAALVAILTRRLHMPYTVGLVLAGMGLTMANEQLQLHLSKELMASLTAGLVMGNVRSAPSNEMGRHAVEFFWEYPAFLTNSLIFMLIGVQEARQHFVGLWPPSFVPRSSYGPLPSTRCARYSSTIPSSPSRSPSSHFRYAYKG